MDEAKLKEVFKTEFDRVYAEGRAKGHGEGFLEGFVAGAIKAREFLAEQEVEQGKNETDWVA